MGSAPSQIQCSIYHCNGTHSTTSPHIIGLYLPTQLEFGHYHKDELIASSVIDFDNKIEIVDMHARESHIRSSPIVSAPQAREHPVDTECSVNTGLDLTLLTLRRNHLRVVISHVRFSCRLR